MKKAILLLVLLAVLAAGGLYFVSNNRANAPTELASNNELANTENNVEPADSSTAPTPTPSQNSGGAELEATFSSGQENTDGGVDVQVVEIAYTGSKYEPSSVNIKVGDYVVFRNNSERDFWPASANHPTHTDYPEFDAKKAIAPGGKFQFQFDKAGTWKFHDHLNPSAFGSVNVSSQQDL